MHAVRRQQTDGAPGKPHRRPLFHRTSCALALTHEGRAFRQAATHVLHSLAEAELSFVDVATSASGTLRVHTTLAFAQHQLAPLVPDFLERHPRVKLEFVLTSDPADLLADDIDVSIQVGPVANASLVVKRIATTHRLICASPLYLKKHGAPRRPEDLLAHNCLNFFPTKAITAPGPCVQMAMRFSRIFAAPSHPIPIIFCGYSLATASELSVSPTFILRRIFAAAAWSRCSKNFKWMSPSLSSRYFRRGEI